MKSELMIPANTNVVEESAVLRCHLKLVGEFYVQRAERRFFLKAIQGTKGGDSLCLFLEHYGLKAPLNENGEYELPLVCKSGSCGLGKVDWPLCGRFGAIVSDTHLLTLVADEGTEAFDTLLGLKRNLGQAHVRRSEQHGLGYTELQLGQFESSPTDR